VTRLGCFALAALAASLAGCLGERERLDVPRVSLSLSDTVVSAGSHVTGTAYAADHSGIVYLRVFVTSLDSLKRSPRLDFIRRDSVAYDFDIPLSAGAPLDSPVEVRVTVIDNQNFQVDVVDTVYVRIPHR
jgi:hypothetical protein